MREFKELLAEKQLEGLSQRDVSEAIKVNQTTISRFKNGKNDHISAEAYARLRIFFGEDFTVGGKKPRLKQSNQQEKAESPKPKEFADAVEFVVEHLNENGKTIVPRYFLGNEDILKEALKEHGIAARTWSTEGGGVVEVVNWPARELDVNYLKTEEPEQPRCEVVDHEDGEDKEPARLRKSVAIDPALAIDHPVLGRAYVLTEDAEPKGLVVNQAFDDLFEDAKPLEPLKTDECGRYYEEEIPAIEIPIGVSAELHVWRKGEDDIHSPGHYTQGEMEAKEIIRAVLEHMPLNPYEGGILWNCLKYLIRFPFKHDDWLDDLKKAQVYLGWLIDDVAQK